MNISGIRTGAGFYDYNSIKINEVRNQQIRESMESEPIPVMGAVEQNDSADIEAVQLQTVQKADLPRYSAICSFWAALPL